MHYTAAGGETIRNEGATKPKVYTKDGNCHNMVFQVAGVTKALAAVNRIVSAGHKVVFDNIEKGSYIENKTTGQRQYLRQADGIYYLDVWVQEESNTEAGFQRPGQP